jgi:hypothetical protein
MTEKKEISIQPEEQKKLVRVCGIVIVMGVMACVIAWTSNPMEILTIWARIEFVVVICVYIIGSIFIMVGIVGLILTKKNPEKAKKFLHVK